MAIDIESYNAVIEFQIDFITSSDKDRLKTIMDQGFSFFVLNPNCTVAIIETLTRKITELEAKINAQ